MITKNHIPNIHIQILLNLKNGVLAYYDKDKNIAQDSPNRSLNLISGVVNNFTIAGGTW
jgi:hypothetical protein